MSLFFVTPSFSNGWKNWVSSPWKGRKFISGSSPSPHPSRIGSDNIFYTLVYNILQLIQTQESTRWHTCCNRGCHHLGR